MGAGEIAGRGAAKQPAWHKHAATPGIAGATYAAGLDQQLTKLAVQLVRWSLSTLRMAGAAECASKAPPPGPSPLWEKKTHRAVPAWVSGLVAICIIMHGRGAGCGRCRYFQGWCGRPPVGTDGTARAGGAYRHGRCGFLCRLQAPIGWCVLGVCPDPRPCMWLHMRNGHARSKHRATPINPQVPTAQAPTGYGRPAGSCHVRRPIPGSLHARQRATLVDVLRVALNVANLIIGEHIITSINPQVPTAQPPLVTADHMGPARPAGTSVAACMANGGLHRPMRFMWP